MGLALSYSKPIRLFVAVALVLAVGAAALTQDTAYSATWPNCNWGCTANDVSLNRVYLADASGVELGPCSGGSNVTAYVWGDFVNGTGTDRYAVWLIFDLWTNGSQANSSVQCDVDVISPGSVSALIWGPMSWQCGQQVTIKNLILSWVATAAT